MAVFRCKTLGGTLFLKKMFFKKMFTTSKAFLLHIIGRTYAAFINL